LHGGGGCGGRYWVTVHGSLLGIHGSGYMRCHAYLTVDVQARFGSLCDRFPLVGRSVETYARKTTSRKKTPFYFSFYGAAG